MRIKTIKKKTNASSVGTSVNKLSISLKRYLLILQNTGQQTKFFK